MNRDRMTSLPTLATVVRGSQLWSLPKSLAGFMAVEPVGPDQTCDRTMVKDMLFQFIADYRAQLQLKNPDKSAKIMFEYETWIIGIEASLRFPEELTMNLLREVTNAMIDDPTKELYFYNKCHSLDEFMFSICLDPDVKITHERELQDWYKVNPKNHKKMPICILEVGGGVSGDEYWQVNRNKTLIKAAGSLVDGILKNLKGQHIDETLVREMLLQTTTAKDKGNIMDQVLQTEDVKDKIQLAQMPPPKRAKMATSKCDE